jgi:hypothetical protein
MLEAVMRSGVSHSEIASEARVSRLVAEAEHLADVSGDPLIRANVLQYGTAVYLQRGSFRCAAEKGREATAMIEATNGPTGDFIAARQAELVALQYLGRNRYFSRTCRETALIAQNLGDRYAMASLRSMSHIERLFADDVPGAHREVDALSRDWPHGGFMVQHLVLGLGRARICLYAGEPRAALETMTQFWPKIEGSPFLRHALIRSDALEWYGRAAAATYVYEGDLRCRRTALSLAARLERGPFGYLAGTANVMRAAIAKRDGALDAALRSLRAARQVFAEQDMQRDAAVVDFCLASAVEGRVSTELRERALRFFEQEEFCNPLSVVRTFGAGFL